MALQTSGQIKGSDIYTFFGFPNGTGIGMVLNPTSSYYYYDPSNTNIPTSGPIKYSNFYGAKKNYFLANASAATDIGAYNTAPWSSVAPNGDTTARWIWNSAGATSSAPAGMWIHFFKQFTVTTGFTGTIYYNGDNYTFIFLNGKRVFTSAASGGNPNWQTVYSASITVPAGLNMLDIYCENAGSTANPAGIMASLYNGSTMVVNTDSTWKCYQSSIDVNKIMVLFSCRLVNPFYTGPIFNIRRSSDNATSDFYTDFSQSFVGTTATGGTSLASWLNGATGYVTIWYDQSSNGNHAKNTANNTSQPNITVQNGKYVLQFQNANATLLTLTSSIQPNTCICQYYNTNSSYGAILTTQLDLEIRLGSGSGTNVYGDSNGADWYYMSTQNGGTCYAYNNGASVTNVLLNGWNYLCLSVTTPQWAYAGQTGAFNRIGYDSYSATRSMNGYMAEMICHNTPMTTTDIANYYNGRMF